jgi:hypothetical protein
MDKHVEFQKLAKLVQDNANIAIEVLKDHALATNSAYERISVNNEKITEINSWFKEVEAVDGSPK